MLNVYEVAKRHDLDTPWRNALRALALIPESGTFMRQGQWEGVKLDFPLSSINWKIEFTSDDDVHVRASETYVVLKKEKQVMTLGWIQKTPDPSPIAPFVA